MGSLASRLKRAWRARHAAKDAKVTDAVEMEGEPGEFVFHILEEGCDEQDKKILPV
jgi:hypothetical protein